MWAYTSTTKSRPIWKARLRLALTLALAICALAIPASASADPSTGGSPYEVGPDYATPNAILGSDYATNAIELDRHRAAVAAADVWSAGLGEPTPVAGSQASADEGFDFASAAVGAGAAMALVALGGAALLTVRRRAAVSPSAPTS
jgi:hypothetical protein